MYGNASVMSDAGDDTNIEPTTVETVDDPVAPVEEEPAPEPKPPAKRGRPPKTAAQREAFAKAQKVRLEQQRESKAKREAAEKRAQKARSIRTAQDRFRDEVSPLMTLIDPFMEISRQQRDEIDHLRRIVRRGGGRKSRSARYQPYGRHSESDSSESDDDGARQLERPSGKNKSKQQPKVPEEKPAAAAEASSDFVPIQKPPPSPPPVRPLDPGRAAAASLARFMSDLGY